LTLDELARLKDEQSSSQNGIPGVQDVNLTQRKVRFVGRATQIARPQVTFAWKIDNSRSPFLPRISVKQNALRSLEMSMTQLREDDGRAPHPYQFELDLFQPEEPSFVAKPAIPAGKMEDSPFAYVDNLEDFRKSLLELSSVKELAIDLEVLRLKTFLLRILNDGEPLFRSIILIGRIWESLVSYKFLRERRTISSIPSFYVTTFMN
jgi:hypothetical protein